MRVIAGSAGGIPLFTPGSDLRPTMDRVKGAIFSSLGEKVIGARVLDLFAGTGALGIEALSRGCTSATFIEDDKRAVAAIRRNLAKTRLDGTIQAMDVFRFLEGAAGSHGFDIIFADPPYKKQSGDRDFATALIQSRTLPESLASGGVFVLEKMPGLALPPSAAWTSVRARKYGSTEVVFLRSSGVSL